MTAAKTALCLLVVICSMASLESVRFAKAANPTPTAATRKSGEEVPPRLVGFERLEGFAARGRELMFSSRLECASCHATTRDESSSGPNLADVGSRLTKRQIALSILSPSAEFADGHKPLCVVTENGEVIRGTEFASTAEYIELILSDGSKRRINRQEIEHASEGTSEMPTGQADELSAQEFADLIAYLASLRQERTAATERSN